MGLNLSEEKTWEYVTNVVLGVSTIATLGFVAAALYSALQRTQVIKTEFEAKADEGKAFSSSKRFSLAAGSSISVVFINKSDKKVKILVGEIDSYGNILIDIYDNITIEAEGNKWNIRNLDLKSTYKLDVQIEDGGTYSGGELVHQTVGYGGQKTFAVGALSEVGEKVIIHPGQNIMLTITNDTTQEIKLSVRFLFYEAD